MFKRFLLSLLFIATLLQATPPSEATVTRLYIATFDRAPDSAGLAYWLNESGLDLEQIAQSFFDQDETKEKYPSGFSHADFIQAIYKNLFKRDTDSEGFEYWHGELEAQKVGRSVFILAVINGALGDDAKVLANKLTVGLKFVQSNRDDVDEAKEIMILITADTSTVNSTLCKYTLSGCYTAPIVEEEEVVEEEEIEEEEETTTSTSGGSTSGGSSGGSTTTTPSNTAPVATAQSKMVDEDSSNNAITLAGTDANSDSLSFTIVDQPLFGTLGGTAPNVTYTPAPNFFGKDSFTFTVNDGTTNSSSTTVSITVTDIAESTTGLKKTGQTTEVVVNDDGNYQKGVDHSYTRYDAFDVVIDNVTGLMWDDYDYDNNIENNIFTWSDAKSYCEDLDVEGNDDWRLPTANELMYITDKGKDTTASNSIFTGIVGADANTYWYWSSTEVSTDSTKVWGVSFFIGDDALIDKTNNLRTMCVRGETWVFSEDNIFKDSGTVYAPFQLTWRDESYTQEELDAFTNQTNHGKVQDWAGAINYCNDLGNDWRLPNFNELYYLINRDTIDHELNSEFENVQNYYWTSTTFNQDGDKAWFIKFGENGQEGYDLKTYKLFVRCVRDFDGI